ncbi:MFS transporter [Streptomyces sp. S.PB5]|nr:MFS transporter [Streptomyces sp. S.PB5]
MSGPSSHSVSDRRQLYKATASGLLGFAIEQYDFILYGTMAALVFGPLFFGSSGWGGEIASFGTFAAGYVARPLGGIIFGHYGDRLGRKRVLIISITLMAISSSLIGLLPTYDQVGLWAPTFLVTLRIAQGIALGGESAGSLLMAAEHSSAKRRGLWSSAPMTGGPLGSLLATGVTAAVLTLPDDQFNAWGWRIPFAMSFVLLAVGIYMRFSVKETPAFEQTKNLGQTGKRSAPLVKALRNPRVLLPCIGIGIGPQALQAIIGTWLVAYGTHLGYDPQFLLLAVGIASGFVILTLPVFGYVSDVLGRKQVIIAGAVGAVITAFPMMWMINSLSPTLLLIAAIWGRTVLQAVMYAPWPALLSESFDTESRYTGASIGMQISTVVAGGFTPMIATSLTSGGHAVAGVGSLMLAAGLVTGVSAAFTRDRRHAELTDGLVEAVATAPQGTARTQPAGLVDDAS